MERGQLVLKARSLAPIAAVAALVAVWPANAAAAPAPTQWCGADLSQTDRKPDHVAGHQIGVVYAYPVGGTDNFATAAPQIVTDLAAVDAWWRREDTARTPRFDLFAFPGCATRLGRLDLAKVALPRDASAYRSLIAGWERLADDLFGPPFGFSNKYKKYIVYYDGPRDDEDVCGIAGGEAWRGPAYAQVYLQTCWRDLGTGGVMAVTAVHELIHALGAVPAGAPHTCVSSSGHVCDAVDDLMYPTTSGEPLDAVVLDRGRDDYYGHSGSWFDVRDSFWLARLDAAQFPLSVKVSGPGHVVSDLPGIDCPGACSIGWESGTRVTLVPRASDGARFSGWKGACSGRDSCTVALDAARGVEATFATGTPGSAGGGAAPADPYRLSVTVSGAGRVSSSPAGISCTRSCSAWFDGGTSVALRAAAARGWRFAGWRGACAQGGGRCLLSMRANRGIRATFVRRR
jgi:hypothetical protein